MDEPQTLPLSFVEIGDNLFKGLVPSSGAMVGVFVKNDEGTYVQKIDEDMVTYKSVTMTVMTLRMLLIYDDL